MTSSELFDYCISKALETPYVKGQSRHYCCIVDKRGQIVAEAANSYTKTNPKMAKVGLKVGLKDKHYCHAEMLALVRAKGKGRKLLVVRVDSRGRPVNSKPCEICEYLISNAKQIKEISYST